jgi:HSP20 family protein
MTQARFNQPGQKTVNTIFDELFNEFPAFWGRDMKGDGNFPAANVVETPDAFHVELMVPGRNKEDFKIAVDKGILTISYEKKAEATTTEDAKKVRTEFNISSFKRSFTLNDKVTIDGIQAKYENGLLKMLLPKQTVKEPAKSINIQ